MNSSMPSSPHYHLSETETGETVIRLHGRMDVETAAEILDNLTTLIKEKSPKALTVDLEDVTHFDDFGALVLFELKHLMSAHKGAFKMVRISNQPQEILSQVSFDTHDKCALPPKPKRSVNILVRLGESTITHTYNIRLMAAFIGSVFLAFVRVLFKPLLLRVDDTITHIENTGVHAIPIVALISFLLGLIIAFMSSLQMQQFGANIYVASLVALAMVSELGPIMTAIIVAGRTGSAFAAEIGTMKISEEVDALFSMGFDPTLFLVIPRMIASIVVVPILTLFFDIFAIFGGLVVGVLILKLSPSAYITQTIDTLSLVEMTWGFAKSIIFAILVSWIACLRGFQTKGGAAAVGNAATSAVVSSLFLIILFDSIIAIIRGYWG
ncbi:MAG: MlaE family lipid ABC transporter permease subunit [Desulfobacterales bacterium]|nr:MlaE family lipid ABC transporter permease subunit [Desulfobacterales bacterium]